MLVHLANVAAVHGAGRDDFGRVGEEVPELRLDAGDLAGAARRAGASEYRAAIGDDRRVLDGGSLGVARVRFQTADLQTAHLERLAVAGVLLERQPQVRRPLIGGGDALREVGARRTHDGAGEGSCHHAAWLRPPFLAIWSCAWAFSSNPAGASSASGTAAHTPTLTLT